jgi:hypothetical protein
VTHAVIFKCQNPAFGNMEYKIIYLFVYSVHFNPSTWNTMHCPQAKSAPCCGATGAAPPPPLLKSGCGQCTDGLLFILEKVLKNNFFSHWFFLELGGGESFKKYFFSITFLIPSAWRLFESRLLHDAGWSPHLILIWRKWNEGGGEEKKTDRYVIKRHVWEEIEEGKGGLRFKTLRLKVLLNRKWVTVITVRSENRFAFTKCVGSDVRECLYWPERF